MNALKKLKIVGSESMLQRKTRRYCKIETWLALNVDVEVCLTCIYHYVHVIYTFCGSTTGTWRLLSRLDYCNSLIVVMQRVLHAAAT